MKIRISVVLVALCALGIAAADAQVTLYYDRAAWEAATLQAATEDLEGFVADVDFRPEGTTVQLAVGEIGQIGLDEAFRNFVDVPPLVFTDHNGTAYVSGFVNFPPVGDGPAPAAAAPNAGDVAPPRPEGAGTGGTDVRLQFAAPVHAFGADFFDCGSAEVLVVDLLDAGDNPIATLDCEGFQPFMGFVSQGSGVSALLFRSKYSIVGGTGEGFGMDDIAIGTRVYAQAIPALSTLGFAALASLLAGAGFLLARKRRAA